MTYPENRTPISWDDVQGVKHQNYSAWESEAKALRARVAALEEALRDVIGMTDQIAKAPMTADRWADRIEDQARAALEAKP